MSTPFKRPVSLTLDTDDMHKLLTDELCGYGPFENLKVASVAKNGNGTWELFLDCKALAAPKPAAAK